MASSRLKWFLVATAILFGSDAQEFASSTISPVDSTTAKVTDSMISDIKIECGHTEMIVKFETIVPFHGMIYPKGLTRNSSCLTEFADDETPVTYRLPLRSCNTMFTETEDGAEYFNTIVIQPHRKLVTNQGRGYHIRCRYQAKERMIISGMNVSVVDSTHLAAAAPLPTSSMHIYMGDGNDTLVAENVKIGDSLTLVIELDEQTTYGLRVTDCSVRDGLGWSEQQLYNDQGCPTDNEIMGPLNYDERRIRASVKFQAHKFPYTPSVYYQCNVKLCLQQGGCEDLPPLCDAHGNNIRRRRRQAIDGPIPEYRISDPEFTRNATIELYTGFYVKDNTDNNRTPLGLPGDEEIIKQNEELCIRRRDFAIGIAIAGLIFMIAVIAIILLLCARRRRKRVSSTTGSSVYSGPYTNTAYSHSS